MTTAGKLEGLAACRALRVGGELWDRELKARQRHQPTFLGARKEAVRASCPCFSPVHPNTQESDWHEADAMCTVHFLSLISYLINFFPAVLGSKQS